MSRIGYPLKLPRSVKEAAARLAREDGVSLNQWIATAVAEKIGTVEATAEFLRRRAAGATADDLLRPGKGARSAASEDDELTRRRAWTRCRASRSRQTERRRMARPTSWPRRS